MSWDIDLIDDRGHFEGDWNYTHNCNRMIAAALLATEGTHTDLARDDWLGRAIGPAWWKRLDGMGGKAGAEYLTHIMTGLEAKPEHYRSINPDNGWGDYDQLLGLLREMRDAVPDWPCTWRASG